MSGYIKFLGYKKEVETSIARSDFVNPGGMAIGKSSLNKLNNIRATEGRLWILESIYGSISEILEDMNNMFHSILPRMTPSLDIALAYYDDGYNVVPLQRSNKTTIIFKKAEQYTNTFRNSVARFKDRYQLLHCLYISYR